MTSCSIVLNFSPPARSMRFVTRSGPGDLSGVSLCISSIFSFLMDGRFKQWVYWMGWVRNLVGDPGSR